MTNGEINHFVSSKDLKKYELKGFKYALTRSKFQLEADLLKIGSKIMNNGKIQKRVPKKDIESFINKGWVLGKLYKRKVQY